MCDQIDFVVCRLCLNSGGELINIFDENNKTEFMLEKTIEDLINVEVVEDKRYPWLVCSTCMEKLTEFRLFKHRCAECLFVFYNRIQKGSKPATKYRIINREEVSNVLCRDNKDAERPGEDLVHGTSGKVWALSSAVDSVDNSVRTASVETDGSYREGPRMNWMAENNCSSVEIQFPDGIKKEIDDETITSDCIDRTAVGAQGDMMVVKEEVDSASGCSASPARDVGSSMVASMQEGDSHWSGNDEAGNLNHSEDGECCLSINLDVEIKEEFDADLPQEEGVMGKEVSRLQDGEQGQDGEGEDGVGNFLHTCQVCKESFAQEDVLKAHVLRVHGVKRKQVTCDVCSKAFVSKDSLGGRAGSEVGREKKHECQHCLAEFGSKKDLRRHMLTHGEVRRNKCEVCAREFSQKKNLKRHMLLHTGEKPYTCGICAKGFTRKRDLEVHILIHSGQRPFRCEICSKGFRYNNNLKRHIKIHARARPQKCELCSMVFNDRRGLMRHRKAHLGNNRLQCSHCLFTSTSKRVLRQHLIELH